MRLLRLGLLAFLSSFQLSAQMNCAQGTQPCSAIQSADLSSVFEVLSGAADGENRVFHLSHTPSTKVSLHLYRNGIELTPLADYTFQDSTITLTGRVIESAGDSLKASYAVDVSGSAGHREVTYTTPPTASATLTPLAPSTPSTSPAPQALQNDTEILSRYLGQALTHELAKAEVASNTGTSQSPAPVAQVKTKASVHDPASLRMLAAAIDRSNERRMSSSQQRSTVERLSMHAEDSSADRYTASPYDLLAVSPDGLGESLDSIDRTVSKRSTVSGSMKVKRMPRSLALLRQRIAGTK